MLGIRRVFFCRKGLPRVRRKSLPPGQGLQGEAEPRACGGRKVGLWTTLVTVHAELQGYPASIGANAEVKVPWRIAEMVVPRRSGWQVVHNAALRPPRVGFCASETHVGSEAVHVGSASRSQRGIASASPGFPRPKGCRGGGDAFGLRCPKGAEGGVALASRRPKRPWDSAPRWPAVAWPCVALASRRQRPQRPSRHRAASAHNAHPARRLEQSARLVTN